MALASAATTATAASFAFGCVDVSTLLVRYELLQLTVRVCGAKQVKAVGYAEPTLGCVGLHGCDDRAVRKQPFERGLSAGR